MTFSEWREGYEQRRAARLAKYHEQEAEIRTFLQLGDEALTDDLLIDAGDATEYLQKKAKACANCKFTERDANKCEYTQNRTHAYNRYLPNEEKPCEREIAYWHRWQAARLIDASGLGERFKKCTFQTFIENEKTRLAKQQCKLFCAQIEKDFPHIRGTKGLLLAGGCGGGKTHLAAAVIHELAEHSILCQFVVVPELFARIRARFNDWQEEKEDPLENIKKAPILVLDDLGAEKMTEWVREQLFLIVNYRYNASLPTLITTNIKGADLSRNLGSRTISRLVEMTLPVFVDAPDHRFEMAAEKQGDILARGMAGEVLRNANIC